MSRPAVLGCLLLAACEPVLLVAETDEANRTGTQQTASQQAPDAGDPSARDADPNDEPSASGSAGPAEPADGSDGDTPKAQLTVKSIDCGSCFDLVAVGEGGAPPYRYEWDDGSTLGNRRVCVGSSALRVWVVVEDANGVRSDPHVANLQTDAGDAGACAPSVRQSQMCLINPSFEGTPALNTGSVFDAMPWSPCFDPSSGTTSNTPDVANNALDWTTTIAPMPRDGSTYLALGTAEQASQQLCEALTARSTSFLQLDAMRLDLGGPDMFLQVWGGISSNCSQRQLLWVSPALTTSWQTYCVTLEPREYMDQLTLRAETPMQGLVASFLVVDNLVPVDACP